jgi:hypothetical protein
MHTVLRILITVLALTTGFADPGLFDAPDTVAAGPHASASLAPQVKVTGAAAAADATVGLAVAAFVDNGLALPDLDIRFHDDKRGCKGNQGLFKVVDGIGVIDLCSSSEFVILHEIGHAWARLNLDDHDRDAFVELVDSPAWSGHDHAWHKRGTEVAANTLAHGLLSEPLESRSHRARELDRFAVLTGIESPRLAAFDDADLPGTELLDDERQNLGAYAAWRAGS